MLPGLADSVFDSQGVFRAVLDAMAHPGRIVELPGPISVPPPLDPAAVVFCLTFADFETPLWLDPVAARAGAPEYLRFHCGVPIVPARDAARFAVIADPLAMPPLDTFDAGTDERPDRSATVIVQVRVLSETVGRRLTGPGIDGIRLLDVRGVPQRFWTEWRANHASFPRGVDVIFSAGTRIAALPRTTTVEA